MEPHDSEKIEPDDETGCGVHHAPAGGMLTLCEHKWQCGTYLIARASLTLSLDHDLLHSVDYRAFSTIDRENKVTTLAHHE